MIANTHHIHMSKMFLPDTWKDRGLLFSSQRIHLKGDVNNNNSCYPYSAGHMCLDLSSPHDACQKRKIERNRENNFDSLHKNNYWKLKDRPFAEGSRGCHAIFVCMLNLLVQKNVMLYCPLWWQPLLCSLSLLFLHHHKFVQRSIFSYTKWSNIFRSNFYCLIALMTTYLKDITQSIGRYGGLLKIRFGFKGFWMHK